MQYAVRLSLLGLIRPDTGGGVPPFIYPPSETQVANPGTRPPSWQTASIMHRAHRRPTKMHNIPPIITEFELGQGFKMIVNNLVQLLFLDFRLPDK
eukprot:691802-Hanusia_phi.AAC.1